MANGKRRANWEKVLEDRMATGRADTSAMVADLNLDLRKQITDLQNEIYVMKKKAVRDRYVIVVVAIISLIALVPK